jgi:hypothetical protein
MAASLPELLDVTSGYMADRARDADGRRRLRDQHLTPLDGGASQRIADEIGRFTREAAAASARKAL